MTTLPHSNEAERGLLACILLDGSAALSKALDGKIAEEAFHNEAHRKVWTAILALHAANMPIDMVVLVQELKKTGLFENVGGMPALVEMSASAPTTAQFNYFITETRELYVRRCLIASAQKTMARAMEGKGSVEEYISDTHEILSIRHATQNITTLDTATDEALAELERIEAGKQTAADKGLEWPWPDWNKRFGAARNGEMMIVAARPGMGKSSVGRQCALKWTGDGNVVLFSREMPVKGMPHLLAQQISGVSWKHVREGGCPVDKVLQFKRALEHVKELGRTTLSIYDVDRTLEQLTARIRALKQTMPIRAVVIDYLQRYDPSQSKGETRDTALGRMSMAFKDIAIDMSIPILVLAQIGRGVERDNRQPRLSDLRESGNLEQDADRVIFLHAPEKDPIRNVIQDPFDGTQTQLYIEAIQAKGRGEGQDRAPLMFTRSTTSFHSIQP